MSNVYVVQQPSYYDRGRKEWVPKYDLTAAETFGDLIYLLGPGNIYHERLENTISVLQKRLMDYTDEDHLLAVGDPVAIATAAIIASKNTKGDISLLKYDRITNQYESYKIKTS